jgi:hypothetical protein
MSYSNPSFRPQIYSYQSRSRFRQYPRDVRTSIPGAGFSVKDLRWGDQVLDLSGLGTDWSRGLSTAEVDARLASAQINRDQTRRTALYVGIGLGAAALLGGGYWLMRGKKAA